MIDRKLPIGIFDSGIGGLTVFKEIRKLMPGENIIYFGDTARVPYGTKSKESVINFSKQIAGYLESEKIKMLVVACNTSSALAMKELRKCARVPVISVIEPCVKAVLRDEKNKKILILATSSTVKSLEYSKQLKKANKNLFLYEKACPLFVPLIEEGCVNRKIDVLVVEEYLRPLRNNKFDAMILGCTHYPLLKKEIKKTMGKTIKIIISSEEAAAQVYKSLIEKKLLRESRKGYSRFIVSDDPVKFTAFADKLLNIKVKNIKVKRF